MKTVDAISWPAYIAAKTLKDDAKAAMLADPSAANIAAFRAACIALEAPGGPQETFFIEIKQYDIVAPI